MKEKLPHAYALLPERLSHEPIKPKALHIFALPSVGAIIYVYI
jgi:hypothetical protein